MDPNSATAASAPENPTTTVAGPLPTTGTRPLTNLPPSRPLTSIPQQHRHVPHQPQPNILQPPQLFPNLSLRPPNHLSTPHFSKPLDPHQSLLYPVASSGRGFIPKPLHPQSPDQGVDVATASGYPSRALVSFPHSHPMQLMRNPYLQNSHPSPTVGPSSAPIKGIPVSGYLKVAPSPSLAADDCNGHKNSRERVKDDGFTIVRDRRVKISDGASLYSVCRSWLRNGLDEESQPHHGGCLKSLPRPLPHLPKKREGEGGEYDNEEDEESVEQLSAQDLLQRHVKRAKRVRTRLREERVQRIARYKTRLSLLLPPQVEFRNDSAAGN